MNLIFQHPDMKFLRTYVAFSGMTPAVLADLNHLKRNCREKKNHPPNSRHPEDVNFLGRLQTWVILISALLSG